MGRRATGRHAAVRPALPDALFLLAKTGCHAAHLSGYWVGMARKSGSPLPDLAGMARKGAEYPVRVTPCARQASLALSDGAIRIRVTEPPEGGRATDAARRLLAAALGVAPSRLTLVRGAASRDKMFRLS